VPAPRTGGDPRADGCRRDARRWRSMVDDDDGDHLRRFRTLRSSVRAMAGEELPVRCGSRQVRNPSDHKWTHGEDHAKRKTPFVIAALRIRHHVLVFVLVSGKLVRCWSCNVPRHGLIWGLETTRRIQIWKANERDESFHFTCYITFYLHIG
jgi:hypothetical protein